jgi:hypothetical protein
MGDFAGYVCQVLGILAIASTDDNGPPRRNKQRQRRNTRVGGFRVQVQHFRKLGDV